MIFFQFEIILQWLHCVDCIHMSHLFVIGAKWAQVSIGLFFSKCYSSVLKFKILYQRFYESIPLLFKAKYNSLGLLAAVTKILCMCITSPYIKNATINCLNLLGMITQT